MFTLKSSCITFSVIQIARKHRCFEKSNINTFNGLNLRFEISGYRARFLYQEWSSHWMIQYKIDVSARILANDWITCSTMLETKYSTVSFLRRTKHKCKLQNSFLKELAHFINDFRQNNNKKRSKSSYTFI